jgi:hypothetical protein
MKGTKTGAKCSQLRKEGSPSDLRNGVQFGNGTFLVLAVAGVGMSREMVDKLNDRFVKIIYEQGTGRGIGLANVNERIKLHYGKEYGLHVESQLGKGTKVIMKIRNMIKAPFQALSLEFDPIIKFLSLSNWPEYRKMVQAL